MRELVNATEGVVSGRLLHEGFFARAVQAPDRPAVLWESGCLSYGELRASALRVAGALVAAGVTPGDTVAVTLPKGPEQVVAVLGVLAAGGVYVPVGVDQPPVRRERILAGARAGWVLTDEAGVGWSWPDGVSVLPIDRAAGSPPLAEPVRVDDQATAYVIFTSGSTGEPKGVQVSHRAAVNTVEDVSARFGVGPQDRVLAVSALDFDLSVYDVFGLLAAGGALVVVPESGRRDPLVWLGLARAHRVTVWNSVPALLDMALTAAGEQGLGEGLRLVLVSGDWVGLDLPGRVRAVAPGCRFVALGGATEAAIWSNACEVDEVPAQWRSVPYGRPLRNQRYRVVDARGRDCPDWVPGELWIGGLGVAEGYRGAPELTAQRFVVRDGVRWYRTGDLGRYWPDGTLEFLGRRDHQVKIRGHRIELGEIETALTQHPQVSRAVAVRLDLSPARLAAAVVPTDGADLGGSDALTVLREWLADRLPSYMLPDAVLVTAALPLTANGKVDQAALTRTLTATVTDQAGEYEPPRGEMEQTVARLWAELLEAERIGRNDSFFALGGDSLLATRLITQLRAEGLHGAELSALFANPVLSAFAAGLTPGRAGADPEQPRLTPDPEHRYDPFPPTDVQRAYWMGRNEEFTLGGVGCHFYTELDGAHVDLDRLEEAWNQLIARHEMLRAVFDDDGRQRILPEVPRLRIPVTDAAPGAEREALAGLREAMSHQLVSATEWPLFDVRAVRYGDRVRIGVSLDNIILDALSSMIVFRELELLYDDLDAALPPVGMSFRDYVTSVRPAPAALARAREYWRNRLEDLPPAPALPTAVEPARLGRPTFERHEHRLSPQEWAALADAARRHDLTPSTVLATAFAEVLSAWSGQQELTVNLTLFDRRDVHPDINNVLGDFTSLLLVAYRARPGESFLETARRLQEQVWRDLEHSEVSAVEILRELARRQGSAEVSMPVVFTSTLGVTERAAVGSPHPYAERVWGISQTPQVWLDHQVVELGGGLLLNWDVVSGLFPAGVVEAMFSAYVGLLSRLVAGDWSAPVGGLLPEGQRRVRELVNATEGVVSGRLLHEGFFARAVQAPDRPAVLWESGCLSYGELRASALRVAGALVAAGVTPGDTVAVTLPKGPEQVVAVLGVLAAGGVYVPVGVDQPPVRRERILAGARAGWVLTDEAGVGWSWPDGVSVLPIDRAAGSPPLAEPVRVDDQATAYVIFTSGSTGEPKGVQVSHRAAVNTVEDVSARFGVGPQDRVLAVSALDFDLSVYDVFGLLAAGGALVVVPESGRRDPLVWLGLARAHRVTVWNSVPALLDMALTAAGEQGLGEGLRLVLVSGDWVGLDLPGRVRAVAPGCRFVALGGATEAAIWSNACEVDEVPAQWRSVPYGRPLRNQRYRVVDARGRDCPDWVPGELWIGGLGVAEGYRGAPELTAQRFVVRDGVRWYRTGDLGRYWPDGTLEFLGRRDHQVKIRGHRIELGEIETALTQHPDIADATVVTAGENRQRLAAFVIPAAAQVDLEALGPFLADRLPAHALPATIEPLPRWPLTANGKVDRAELTRRADETAAAAATDDDGQLRGDIEVTLAKIWAELLDLPTVGRGQNFFALGGDSVLATRLVAQVRDLLGVELSMRQVFDSPTVAGLAERIAERQAGDDAFEEGVL
ncbi:amino acid adenylation domain-containing protein [Micromonospora sp. DR5-3]|nr:non-ribosomal peptide synthetase [Micromonospora sp. DR5-3]MCW3819600.1 amino acid adenylation domain-containing protein [Micromonospora sp. DR5-3]